MSLAPVSIQPFRPRVFSGVQPTGNLHLGNYLGAIRKFVALQENNDCIYCVVDLHALTAQLVHEDMATQIRSITAAFLAAGIDPKKHIVFNQSQVPQHAELAWIFNCVARIGWMNRMTQFKDKTAGKNAEAAWQALDARLRRDGHRVLGTARRSGQLASGTPIAAMELTPDQDWSGCLVHKRAVVHLAGGAGRVWVPKLPRRQPLGRRSDRRTRDRDRCGSCGGAESGAVWLTAW